jgi:hypothetical protein
MKSTFYLFILLIASCHAKINSEIEGHWTTVNVVDNTGMHITDDASFNKDGSYKLIMYSNGDSIVSELQGAYKFDQLNQTVTITTNGMTFQHKILELGKETMKIKTQQGTDVLMKRIK